MKTLKGLIQGFRDTRGFSLAEVLMATAMLIVGIAVVLSALMYGVAGVEGSRGTSTAVFLAEQKLEQVRAFAVSTTATQGFSNLTTSSFPAESTITGYPNFRRNAATFSSLIASAPTNGEVAMFTNASLPGLGTSTGTYSVIVRNDNRNGDPVITGVAKETSVTADANNRLILVATGNFGTATRQVMVKKTALPPTPGALNFPGNDANTSFTDDSFQVSGNDYTMTGGTGSCASVYGITTGTTTNESLVQGSLTSAQKDNVTGKKQVSSGTANGDNTIAPDSTLTQASISTFLKDAARNADISLYSPSPGGLSFNDVSTANCATNYASQGCWGTAAKPKVVYIKGAPDPTSAFTALTLNGNVTGYGVLIVEDAPRSASHGCGTCR
jgi:Tfp pilus assembly protein PilV